MASVSLPQSQPQSQLQQQQQKQQVAPSSDAKLQINHASQTAAISANFWLLPTSVFRRANKMKTRKTKKTQRFHPYGNVKSNLQLKLKLKIHRLQRHGVDSLAGEFRRIDREYSGGEGESVEGGLSRGVGTGICGGICRGGNVGEGL